MWGELGRGVLMRGHEAASTATTQAHAPSATKDRARYARDVGNGHEA